MDLHVVPRMNFAVTYLLAHSLEERFDMLVDVPTVHSAEWREAERF
jgi:hypothetical protein